MKLLVRSLACCVLATAARAQVVVVYPPPPQPVTVVIERERPAPMGGERQDAYAPAQQITYLIALKDGEVRIAEQYWVKGETLHYLTADHEQRTVPANNLDLALTIRLNSERNVAFSLPTDQERAAARSHIIRHTAKVVHNRCNCAAIRSTRSRSSGTGGASRGLQQHE